jgi:hypothetical protein
MGNFPDKIRIQSTIPKNPLARGRQAAGYGCSRKVVALGGLILFNRRKAGSWILNPLGTNNERISKIQILKFQPQI